MTHLGLLPVRDGSRKLIIWKHQ